MGFDGDLDQLTPTDAHKEDLKRSVHVFQFNTVSL